MFLLKVLSKEISSANALSDILTAPEKKKKVTQKVELMLFEQMQKTVTIATKQSESLG